MAENTDTLTTWEPLPLEIAEWMGAAELGERAREVAPPLIAVPRQLR